MKNTTMFDAQSSHAPTTNTIASAATAESLTGVHGQRSQK